MRRLHDLAIRKKATLILLVATAGALLATAATIVVYELTTFRPKVLREVSTQAEILEPGLAAALRFLDRDAAEEDLGALRDSMDVVVAAVLDLSGQVFAEYHRPGSPEPVFPELTSAEDRVFDSETVTVWRPLVSAEETLGTLLIQRRLPPLFARMPQYGLMLGMFFLVLISTGLFVSMTLRRSITEPLVVLAEAAERVQEKGEYSVRVVKQGNDEIGRLTESFNKMLGTIEQREAALERAGREQRELQERLAHAQKMESIGRLAGSVAHDFNNLLTIIVGSTELAMAKLPPDSPQEKILGNIQHATSQASELTRQLLAFARKQVVEPAVFYPDRFLLEHEGMLRTLIGDSLDLAVIPGRDVWPVLVDPNQLTQVLLNLATNARDAMGEGGVLTVEAQNLRVGEGSPAGGGELAGGDYVMLSVTDTGVGMADDVRARIFDPFFTTKERGKGTGLGLSTCYGIVTQCGGSITVESEQGKGTTFRVFLPRTREHAGETSGLPVTPRPDQAASGGTVLLVEDNAVVRSVTASILRAQGYDVLEAAGGPDALRLFAEHRGPVDLLLTDVMMPQMGGPEVARHLRSRQPGLPVLFISGYAADDLPDRDLRGPDVAFLPKPFTSDALIRRVRRLLHGGLSRRSDSGRA